MGDEQVEVLDPEAGAGEGGNRRIDHAAHGVPVDLTALHAQQPLLGPRVQQVAVDAVAAQFEGGAAEVQLAARDDDGGRGVAEEDRGRAVLHVGDPRERLGPAHQHDVGPLRLHERRGLLERGQEAGAGRIDVVRAGPLRADQGRHLGRETRREAVRRDRRDDHAIDRGPVAVGVGEGVRARLGGEVGQRAGPVEPAALADPGAADDPLVARVEPLDERRVGDHGLGQRGAHAEDSRTHTATASGTIRRTMPVSTRPGPSSTNRSIPAARMASTVSRQRTGRSRFSASSRRGWAKGAALPPE